MSIPPYHRDVCEYLRTFEPELWEWYSSSKALGEYVESVRLELLKSSYRLDAATFPDLHSAADEVKAALGLDLPLTLYQSQSGGEMNARIYYLPGEAHVVLQGQLHGILTPSELRALLGHELSHYRLWTAEDGAFLTASRILTAMAMDPRAENSHLETARRFDQYVEIYADRGALAATGDLHAVVGSLVKVQTGLKEVSAAKYLEQAAEIFSKTAVQSAGLTHPEAYIRARALALWHEAPEAAEARIREMIEGPSGLRELDLLGQASVSGLVRRIVAHLLDRAWFATESVVALSRLYFPESAPGAPEPREALAGEIAATGASVREFLACVLTDFALVDRALEEAGLAHALELAAALGLSGDLEERLKKELKLTKKALESLKKRVPELVEAASRPQGDAEADA